MDDVNVHVVVLYEKEILKPFPLILDLPMVRMHTNASFDKIKFCLIIMHESCIELMLLLDVHIIYPEPAKIS